MGVDWDIDDIIGDGRGMGDDERFLWAVLTRLILVVFLLALSLFLFE